MAKKIGGAALRFFIRAAIGMALILSLTAMSFRQILQLMWV